MSVHHIFISAIPMKVFPSYDKSLWPMLAQGSISYEKCLLAEQFSFFTIGKFATGIKNASTTELLQLRKRLANDLKAYPRKAYFFNALLKIVKSQLKKNG
ncbi:hypothetical protein GXP67_34050 [Rhodocytophaga rosea]|uniref:Uncharacterized protein n=1 Tax=Rhodocytophaga rosea TaxID=2704465 RepID=A0A6C0GU26_9BACT|nr:hypothetical protein [Rhodocytophaga rosea]QHT71324.1 hypothetical protein GXP67_34050 [Rhodocytophaga rosea]